MLANFIINRHHVGLLLTVSWVQRPIAIVIFRFHFFFFFTHKFRLWSIKLVVRQILIDERRPSLSAHDLL